MTTTTKAAPGSSEAIEEQITALADEATTIVQKAETDNRDFTPDEQARIKAIFDEAKELRSARTKSNERAEIRDQIDGLVSPEQAKELNDAVTKGFVLPRPELSVADRVLGDEKFKAYLGQWPHGIPESTRGINTPPVEVGSLKALLTGGSDTSAGAFVVPQQYPSLFPTYQQPLVLRNLVTPGTTGTDSIEYARLVTVDNNAAIVAEATDVAGVSGTKPQSDMTFARVTTPVRTVAHWLAATKRALADAGQLRTLIDGFLRYGLEETLEAQMLTGDGTGENFTGLLNTPGTLAQPWDTDMLTTIRKAITTVQNQVYTVGAPTAIVLNPADDETLDLAKDENGNFLAGPSTPWSGITPRTVWGLPRVISRMMPAGTALLGNFRAAVLWDREASTVSATDTHADFFIRNLVAVLAELRAGFGVLFPPAFVEVDLTAV